MNSPSEQEKTDYSWDMYEKLRQAVDNLFLVNGVISDILAELTHAQETYEYPEDVHPKIITDQIKEIKNSLDAICENGAQRTSSLHELITLQETN